MNALKRLAAYLCGERCREHRWNAAIAACIFFYVWWAEAANAAAL